MSSPDFLRVTILNEELTQRATESHREPQRKIIQIYFLFLGQFNDQLNDLLMLGCRDLSFIDAPNNAILVN